MKHFICIQEADNTLTPIIDSSKPGKKAVLISGAHPGTPLRIPFYLAAIPGHNEKAYIGTLELPRKKAGGDLGEVFLVFALAEHLTVSCFLGNGDDHPIGKVVISAHCLREAKAILGYHLSDHEQDTLIEWEAEAV